MPVYHKATCLFCKKIFDRNAEPFAIESNGKRYAHAACAEAIHKERGIAPPVVVDPLKGEHICDRCRGKIEADEQCLNPRNDIYLHMNCAKPNDERTSLEEYIAQLFDMTWCGPINKRLITKYVNDYGYTYQEIKDTLSYFYHVEKNPVSKANGTIAIVPYVHDRAMKYSRDVKKAKEANENVVVNEQKEINVHVEAPIERRTFRPRLDAFMDEDEESE